MSLRHWFGNLPIRRQLSLLLLAPSVVVLLLGGTVVVWFQLSTFRRTFERDLVAVADIVAHNSTAAIAFKDEAAATEILNALRAKEHITGAALVLPGNKVFATYGNFARAPVLALAEGEFAPVAARRLELIQKPIVLDGKPIATLYVVSDYRKVYRSVVLVGGSIGLLVGLAAIGLAGLLSSRLQRFVSEPLGHLAETSRLVADAGDFSVRARDEGGAEIGVLTRAFNQMLARIEAQDAALQKASAELSNRVQDLEREIAERLQAEQKLAELHKQLMDASRRAGMAEVASGVLHNVGNVLNSVNVSISVVNEKLRRARAHNFDKLAELLTAHRADLAHFLTEDTKGKLVPEYLVKLCHRLATEQSAVSKELHTLSKNVDHIKQIVATQQNYARMGGLVEEVPVESLVEDALQIHAAAFIRQKITLERQFKTVPPVRVDKHKVLQILVNLFQNARQALNAAGVAEKRIEVAIQPNGPDHVCVVVKDNGVGIPVENLTRIFQHGFTTKPDGHGFGLHSGAVAAREMGGSLDATSEGQGRGATFTLDLPAVADKSNTTARKNGTLRNGSLATIGNGASEA